MSQKVAQLQDIIAPAVEALGFELWGCELQVGRHASRLQVYVDSENGITIDQCAMVSRQIAAVLDVEDPFPGAYNLEVSSPGIQRPLFTLAHYQRYVGQRVKLRLGMPLNGRRNFSARIKAVVGDDIVLEWDSEEAQFPVSAIEKAHLVADF